VSDALPLVVAVLPARVIGTLLIALPLILARRFSIPRAALPYVVTTGLAEVVGYSTFVLGAREGIAVTAVLAALFAPLAAIAAFVLFRERLAGRQIAGIVFVTIGVATLGLLRL
jgi:drug/metabolite transporter (DMT)-like permease